MCPSEMHLSQGKVVGIVWNLRRGEEKQQTAATSLERSRAPCTTDGGQAKEGKGASLPCLELLVSFPGTGSDEFQNYRGAQG